MAPRINLDQLEQDPRLLKERIEFGLAFIALTMRIQDLQATEEGLAA